MSRIVVLGAGESGVGAAVLAKSKGYEVFVSDFGNVQDKYRVLLQEEGIDWEEQQHTEASILNADEVVKSPGIPDKAPMVQKIRERGIPVISEIEFAARFTNAKLIAITGSNGKTTTTMLIYEMLKNVGCNIGLAGNVGQSFALQVAREHFDVYVLEISSFQLDGMYRFKADIGILTNITPDHLDRYNNDFQLYVDSKFRITQNLSEGEFLLLCKDDTTIQENKQQKLQQRTNVLEFGISEHADAYVEGSMLKISANGRTFEMNMNELSLKGRHNTYNSMAAALTGILMDLRDEQIRESLRSFKAVEHRLEEVLTIRGIRFINDSKATNVNSTWYALESMTQKTVLILGGVDKGNDYSLLNELVEEKVKAVVCLGKDNSRIVEAFAHMTELVETDSMQEAVRSAYYLAQNGENVLLSPACASFDLFNSYEDRGKQFKEQVNRL